MEFNLENIYDIPDDRDYLFDEYLQEENGEGIKSAWIDDYFKILDQWQTPMCSLFAGYSIINMYNILEDKRNVWTVVREQKDPKQFGIDNVRSIQVRVEQFRKEGLIEWYLSIPKVWVKTPTGIMTKERRLQEIKTAFQKWYFIYTGTDRTDRTIPQNPILKLWSEIKQWHIIPLTGSDYTYHSTGNLLRTANSFWKKRGDDWYGYIKESDVDKLYTCYVFIPKTNSEFFKTYKKNKKRNEWIKQWREFYQEDVKDWNIEAIKYFDNIQLSKTLTKLRKL